MDFFEALERLGFRLAQDRPSRGSQAFVSQRNAYLTYWIHVYDDGSALFTWEFAVTDYLLRLGIQLGSSERLNLFMFPVEDDRGVQEAGWLAGAMDRADARLRSVDFTSPEAMA
ncbi:hypothetical protein BH20ACT24_BH20ACT24_22810 [soil metagenome]|nr:hypothetical protein [Actinomycetota bacterium]